MAIEPAAISASPAITTSLLVADGGPGESGRQRERNGQAVGHPDDHIADRVRRFEVRFHVHVHEVL